MKGIDLLKVFLCLFECFQVLYLYFTWYLLKAFQMGYTTTFQLFQRSNTGKCFMFSCQRSVRIVLEVDGFG